MYVFILYVIYIVFLLSCNDLSITENLYLCNYSFSLRIMSASPSISNPPKAPKKSESEYKIPPVWQQLRKSGKVRSQWAFYTPEDIQEIDDRETLTSLFETYSNPPSWLYNDAEWTYCTLMCWCVVRKLETL